MARGKSTSADYKVCADCKVEKRTAANFYKTNSPMFPDGRVSICKSCIQKQIDVTDINSIKGMLRSIDKPFISEIWQNSLDSGREPFGEYLKMISGLHQYNSLTYDQSVEGEVDDLGYKYTNDEITDEDLYGKPTIETLRKWGTGYSTKEYHELEKTWTDMMTTNDITTPQHIDSLFQYCKLKVLVNRALEENDMKTFETLNKAFAQVQKDSGFRPIDKVSGSESAGVRNFSTIFSEIEKEGFIPPLPLDFEQDVIDATIMHLQNYTRKILDMGKLTGPDGDTPQVEDYT